MDSSSDSLSRCLCIPVVLTTTYKTIDKERAGFFAHTVTLCFLRLDKPRFRDKEDESTRTTCGSPGSGLEITSVPHSFMPILDSSGDEQSTSPSEKSHMVDCPLSPHPFSSIICSPCRSLSVSGSMLCNRCPSTTLIRDTALHFLVAGIYLSSGKTDNIVLFLLHKPAFDDVGV